MDLGTPRRIRDTCFNGDHTLVVSQTGDHVRRTSSSGDTITNRTTRRTTPIHSTNLDEMILFPDEGETGLQLGAQKSKTLPGRDIRHQELVQGQGVRPAPQTNSGLLPASKEQQRLNKDFCYQRNSASDAEETTFQNAGRERNGEPTIAWNEQSRWQDQQEYYDHHRIDEVESTTIYGEDSQCLSEKHFIQEYHTRSGESNKVFRERSRADDFSFYRAFFSKHRPAKEIEFFKFNFPEINFKTIPELFFIFEQHLKFLNVRDAAVIFEIAIIVFPQHFVDLYFRRLSHCEVENYASFKSYLLRWSSKKFDVNFPIWTIPEEVVDYFLDTVDESLYQFFYRYIKKIYRRELRRVARYYDNLSVDNTTRVDVEKKDRCIDSVSKSTTTNRQILEFQNYQESTMTSPVQLQSAENKESLEVTNSEIPQQAINEIQIFPKKADPVGIKLSEGININALTQSKVFLETDVSDTTDLAQKSQVQTTRGIVHESANSSSKSNGETNQLLAAVKQMSVISEMNYVFTHIRESLERYTQVLISDKSGMLEKLQIIYSFLRIVLAVSATIYSTIAFLIQAGYKIRPPSEPPPSRIIYIFEQLYGTTRPGFELTIIFH